MRTKTKYVYCLNVKVIDWFFFCNFFFARLSIFRSYQGSMFILHSPLPLSPTLSSPRLNSITNLILLYRNLVSRFSGKTKALFLAKNASHVGWNYKFNVFLPFFALPFVPFFGFFCTWVFFFQRRYKITWDKSPQRSECHHITSHYFVSDGELFHW